MESEHDMNMDDLDHEEITPEEKDSFLIWEYLDGEITPGRSQELSSKLSDSASMRERFVEYATLHSMLFDYFKQVAQQDKQTVFSKIRRKFRRHGAA